MKVKHSYGILRRMVATIVIIVTTTSVNAHSVADVSGIAFGTSYREPKAVWFTVLKTLWEYDLKS